MLFTNLSLHIWAQIFAVQNPSYHRVKKSPIEITQIASLNLNHQLKLRFVKIDILVNFTSHQDPR